MDLSNKRINKMKGVKAAKSIKRECWYGESCYRLNPAHFILFSHRHLESILDKYSGTGNYDLPKEYKLHRALTILQLNTVQFLYGLKNSSQTSNVSQQAPSNVTQIKNKGSSSAQMKKGTSKKNRDSAQSASSKCGGGHSRCRKGDRARGELKNKKQPKRRSSLMPQLAP